MAVDPSEFLAQHLARVPVHRALIRSLEHRLFAEEVLEHPVLDIGCGDGHYAAAAFPDGIDVGVDITWPIVAEARRRGPYKHLDVADGTRLPYADASFRTVVGNCVIEHIVDIEGVVQEVARVLVPGGRFIFSVPGEHFTEMLFTVGWLSRLGMSSLARRHGRWWNGNAAHHHLDSPEIWQARLSRYGLTIDRHTYYMSAEATRAFELSHYYAVPSIVWHKLTGRWSLRSGKVRNSLANRWLSRYAEEPWPDIGSCSFFVAYK